MSKLPRPIKEHIIAPEWKSTFVWGTIAILYLILGKKKKRMKINLPKAESIAYMFMSNNGKPRDTFSCFWLKNDLFCIQSCLFIAVLCVYVHYKTLFLPIEILAHDKWAVVDQDWDKQHLKYAFSFE